MEFKSSDKAPAAVGPYSQAVQSGNLIFCSGMIPLDPETKAVVGDDIASQTQQVFANLNGLMSGIGASLNQVVKTTVFLTNMGDFGAFNAIYAEAFGDHKPARSTVEVAALPLGVLVEIECIVEVA